MNKRRPLKPSRAGARHEALPVAQAEAAPAGAASGPPASYSTAEVAALLGVSTPTVQRWVDAGHLQAWKTPGGHRRIDGESARRMQQLQRRGRMAAPREARSLQVLIVDDDESDRELLMAAVNIAWPKAQLRSYDNGFHALLAMGGRMPDVLISDIVMPHMDGLQMLQRLGESGHALPPLTVVVSAQADHAGRPRVALPEGVHFLAKPLDGPALVALLKAQAAQLGGLPT